MTVHGALIRARRAARVVGRELSTEVDRARYRRSGGADLALFHEFAPAPTGGGHQFLRALVSELERRGVAVELNRISRATPACLFNSFNFDFRRLRRFARPGCRMVHRLDGPIGVYRGFDDGTDARIAQVNGELADATVVQSQFSLEAHRELGIELREPVVIANAVDPAIFHPPAARDPLDARKARLIAVSWSDNPNKGAEVFAWLDENLDWERYEMSFVGRSPAAFLRIRVRGPVPSRELANELRRHDVYVAASRNDPCSNALLEALACGLPAVYLASGGHPELVGDGGLPFVSAEEVPEVLERLLGEVDDRRGAIRVPSLEQVADRYLEVLRG
ncbi:MAG: glycosyltransferase family 4 protein [Actinobacteria bacterium]|nr:MAG: glycosyltransferase family 4 protein [Actinomycetota bacterium]